MLESKIYLIIKFLYHKKFRLIKYAPTLFENNLSEGYVNEISTFIQTF